jgi:hypothetical protein
MLFNAPHVLLDSLAPDVTYRRDLTDIVLRVIAAPQFFDTNTVVLQRERRRVFRASTTTFFTNYSVTWDEQAGTSGYRRVWHLAVRQHVDWLRLCGRRGGAFSAA